MAGSLLKAGPSAVNRGSRSSPSWNQRLAMLVPRSLSFRLLSSFHSAKAGTGSPLLTSGMTPPVWRTPTSTAGTRASNFTDFGDVPDDLSPSAFGVGFSGFTGAGGAPFDASNPIEV